MKRLDAIYLRSLIFLLVLFFSLSSALERCECSGIFPSVTSTLWQQVKGFIEAGSEPSIGDVVALIVPSSRLVFSGVALGSAYSATVRRNPDRVIIIVKSNIEDVVISSVPSFRTPLGPVHSDINTIRTLVVNYYDIFKDSLICPPDAFWLQLPFIKYLWQNVPVIPVLVGNIEREKIAHLSQILSSLPGRSLVVGVSCFEPVGGESETPLPSISMAHLLSLDVEGFWSDVDRKIVMPESPSVVALALSLAKKSGAENGVLLRRMTSAGINSKGSANLVSLAFVSAFTKTPASSHSQVTRQSIGEELLNIAEQSILSTLGNKPYTVSTKTDFPAGLGVFISLSRNDSILACAGELFLTSSIDVSTAKFAQLVVKSKSKLLKAEHLEGSELVVNIAEPVSSPEDEKEPVGIYVRHREKVGVLFPSEERNLSLSKRLASACLRAGLFSDCWCKPEVEIRYFKVQQFSKRFTGIK